MHEQSKGPTATIVPVGNRRVMHHFKRFPTPWVLRGKKTGGMPPKSQLHWVAKAEREPPAREREGEPGSPPPERPAPVAVPMAVPPAEADTAKPQPKAPTAQFRTVRVRPATAASVRPGNGQVSEYVGGYQDWLRQAPKSASHTSTPTSKTPPASTKKSENTQKPNSKEQKE